eukprot:TRINITY_DN5165_c0_g4_i1.p1 TRINITY_DN5165_c0_g4~~TRINITY_DN5165_c0_g4_i1.p1  ORF type:complete len:582 (+),score=122.52 TRINITY_DN5165_c0_g4_i1:877-2622(+)
MAEVIQEEEGFLPSRRSARVKARSLKREPTSDHMDEDGNEFYREEKALYAAESRLATVKGKTKAKTTKASPKTRANTRGKRTPTKYESDYVFNGNLDDIPPEEIATATAVCLDEYPAMVEADSGKDVLDTQLQYLITLNQTLLSQSSTLEKMNEQELKNLWMRQAMLTQELLGKLSNSLQSSAPTVVEQVNTPTATIAPSVVEESQSATIANPSASSVVEQPSLSTTSVAATVATPSVSPVVEELNPTDTSVAAIFPTVEQLNLSATTLSTPSTVEQSATIATPSASSVMDQVNPTDTSVAAVFPVVEQFNPLATSVAAVATPSISPVVEQLNPAATSSVATTATTATTATSLASTVVEQLNPTTTSIAATAATPSFVEQSTTTASPLAPIEQLHPTVTLDATTETPLISPVAESSASMATTLSTSVASPVLEQHNPSASPTHIGTTALPKVAEQRESSPALESALPTIATPSVVEQSLPQQWTSPVETSLTMLPLAEQRLPQQHQSSLQSDHASFQPNVNLSSLPPLVSLEDPLPTPNSATSGASIDNTICRAGANVLEVEPVVVPLVTAATCQEGLSSQ